MKLTLNRKHALAVGAIIALGVLLAALIVGVKPAAKDDHGHDEHAEEVDHGGKAHSEAAEAARGAHGGKLFTSEGYGLEITIFEHNVEPEFRIYIYQDGAQIAPAGSKVTLTLERLGRPAQTIRFAPENDYLKGDATVSEPHSFKVAIAAQAGGKAYRFHFEQVEARITMSEQQAALSGIDIHTAGPARIQSVLKLAGEIQLNADRTVHIAPRLAGQVLSVAVNAGDTVRKGQVLAVIASQELAGQRSELLAAQRRYQLARTVYLREHKLWEEKITAEQDVQQARGAMQEAGIAVDSAREKLAALGAGAGGAGQLARHEIRSPISGTVTEKRIAVGEVLKEDASVFIVADLSTVWAEVAVSARDLDTIRQGQQAMVKGAAAEAAGAVSYVSALVGEQTRAATARIVLPNPKGNWRPGLPVNVEVVAAEVTVPVAVSVDAVQTVNEQTAVFGRYGDHFEARPLELGRGDGKSVEVLKGLSAGEKYAAKNSYLIKADLGKAGASHDH